MTVREGHVSLPWWSWVVVGLLISGYAKTVEVKTSASGMTLFVYVGLGFVLFGLKKVALMKQRRTEQERLRLEQARYRQALQREQVRQEQVMTPRPAPEHRMVVCPRCGAQQFSTHQFCFRCGMRLR